MNFSYAYRLDFGMTLRQNVFKSARRFRPLAPGRRMFEASFRSMT
jgi:hypothetical protein